jgi:type I restriction enzyme R subunit
LPKETVLLKEDLHGKPFSDDVGFIRLNEIFDNKLENILVFVNDYLYTA